MRIHRLNALLRSSTVCVVVMMAACGENGSNPTDDWEPGIASEPTIISLSVPETATIRTLLTIMNQGTATLNVISISDDRDWLSESPTGPSVLFPDSSMVIWVTVSPMLLPPGSYSGEIQIQSDDPDDSEHDVGVDLTLYTKDLDETLLLENGAISDLTRRGELQIAADYESLHEMIGEGSDQFMNNGFVLAFLQDYSMIYDQTVFSLELFIADMTDRVNSQNIYNIRADLWPMAEGMLLQGFVTGRKDEVSALPFKIADFWQSKFYVMVVLETQGLDPMAERQLILQFSDGTSHLISWPG